MKKKVKQLQRIVLGAILFLLAGGLCGFLAAAEGRLPSPPGSYAFKAFGPDQGLLCSTITSLAKDRDGTIWVASEDGLYRMEGQRFQKFGQEDGLPSSYIQRLIPPKDGGLWVITNLGLSFWDGKRFCRPSERGVPDADESGQEAIVQDSLVPVEDYGVLLMKGDTPRLVTGKPGVRALPELRGMLRSPMNAWGSIETREMILSSRTELLFWKDGKVSRHPMERTITKTGRVAAILRDRRGVIWIRTENALLNLRAFEAPATLISGPKPLGMTNYGVDLREDPHGRIWTEATAGLFWYQDGMTGRLDASLGLPQAGTNFHFLFDGEENLWVCADGLLMQQGRFLWRNHGRAQGMPGNTVWRVARGGDGRLWAAVQGGLAKAEGKRWVTVPGTQQRTFYTLMPDAQGHMWLSGSMEGARSPYLWEVNPGEAWPHRVPLLGFPDIRVVWEIVFDKDNVICLATLNEGLLRGRRTAKGLQLEQIQIPGWPLHQSITILANGPDGSLWAGSERGIAVREKDGRWQVFSSGNDIPRQNPGALMASPSGDIWASYAGEKELTLFRKVEGSWKVVDRIRPPRPLVQDTILAIGFEPDGTLVLGTSRGVKWWNRKTMERYGREWGLASEDVTQSCLWRDPNGDWWVGTPSGLSQFVQHHYQPVPPLGRIKIQRVLDGESKQWPVDGQGAFPRIPYRRASLAFHFHPEGILGAAGATVQVRLGHGEAQWRDTEALSAVYSSLAPGRYTFEARLLGREGTAGPVSAFAFEILPPWYQSHHRPGATRGNETGQRASPGARWA